MSTLGSLMFGLSPNIAPYDPLEVQKQRTANQTGLINLADLKAKQAAEQEFLLAVKNDPEVARRLFGEGPVLGSLQQPQPPPGAAPMTQQTVMPGQAPGVPQTVPGGQNLSQFATQGGPPQSTIGSLGPAGQAQMQAPRNPVLEMAAKDPRAAMMMQQQLEGRQDAAMKRQEQQLTMGTKIMDYLGRGAQGVTDQASLDAFREETARVHPQAAASLPQVYSKEAMQPFIAKALDVKEALTLQVQDLTAQAAVIKARKEGRAVDVDNQLRAMGVQPGQETPAQMKEALKAVEDAKVRVSASQGTGQIVPTQEGLTRINPRTGDVEVIKGPQGQTLYPPATGEAQKAQTFGDLAQKAHREAVALEDKGLKPSLWDKGAQSLPLGIGNYLVSEDRRAYTNAINRFGEAWLRKTSGAVLSPAEYKKTDETYFPQPNDTQAQIEAKRAAREAVIQGMQEEGKQTGRTGTQAQPTSQGTSGGQTSQGSAKPVGQMSREELVAERDRLRKGGG